MEKPPTNLHPESNKNISFESAKEILISLLISHDEKNNFLENLGGFDNFAESWAHLPEYREIYDGLEMKSHELRKQFDSAVPDKVTFIKELRLNGMSSEADRISRVFLIK